MQIGSACGSLTCTKPGLTSALHSLRSCSSLSVQTGLIGRQMPLSDTRKAAIVFIRNDIRLTDHEPLLAACSNKPNYVVPLYCLNPALLHPRSDCPSLGGIPVLGPHRCRFLLEALQSLQQSLQALGSNLYFTLNKPDQALPALVHGLAEQVSHIDLYHYLQIGQQFVEEEDAAADAFTDACGRFGVASEIHQFWGHTMYHPQDALAALSVPVGKGRRPAAQPTIIPHDIATFNRDQQLFSDVPSVMTNFRKAMETHGVVRDPLPRPDQIPPYPSGIVGASSLPKDVSSLYRSAGAEASLAALEQLTGCAILFSSAMHPHSAFALKGGETEGVKRLQYYLYGKSEGAETALISGPCDRAPQHNDNADTFAASDAAAMPTPGSMRGSERVAENSSGEVGRSASASPPIDLFKDTRMLAGGMDNSAKVGAYLAAGCLSPRMIYAEIQRARQKYGADSGHSWLVMHLTIRDFFLYTALKEGDNLEQPGGIQGKAKQWRHSDEEFHRWCQGRTGFPFVDACMRELAATGYMSNRGRQNVSSFLCKAMGHSLQIGVAVFESLLVDHDWAVNTVNWAYFAGVGNDPRDRIFRTVSQGMTYDPEAQLIKTWVPELKKLPGKFAHKPWELEKSAADACGFELSRDYVAPMLDASTQIAVNYGRND